MRWVLRFFALLCLGLGIVGVFLPGLPTTVFILMASWAAARSSPRIHAWLHRHKLFGPMLRNWEAGGYVSRRAKYQRGHHHGVERRHLVVAGPALVGPHAGQQLHGRRAAVAVAQTRTTHSNRKKLKNFPTLLRKPKFHAYNRGSSLIAQSVERRTVNPQVPGSSPGRGAKI